MTDRFAWLDTAVGKEVAAAADEKRDSSEPSLSSTEKALQNAMVRLPLEKQIYIECLLTSATYAEARRALKKLGHSRRETTLSKWRKEPAFFRALQAARELLIESIGVDRTSVILDAERIKELALQPRQEYVRGLPTGQMVRDLNIAMRAVEFQGKAVGVGQDEGSRTTVVIDIDFSGPLSQREYRHGETYEHES